MGPGDHWQGLRGLTASSRCASVCAARLHSPWIHATGEWARGAGQSAAASAHCRTPLRPPRVDPALQAEAPSSPAPSVLPCVTGDTPSLCSEGLPSTPALSSFALCSCLSLKIPRTFHVCFSGSPNRAYQRARFSFSGTISTYYCSFSYTLKEQSRKETINVPCKCWISQCAPQELVTDSQSTPCPDRSLTLESGHCR